jgi:ABC-type antimicrobial peptide transport system permease subunit
MRAETKFVVVSEALARRLWGDRNPIGAMITPGTHSTVGVDGKTEVPETAIVVGTVASMPLGDLTDPTTMQVFVPQTKHFLVAEQGVLIRTNQRAEAVLPSIRVVMRQLDDRLPLIGVGTLEQELDRQVGAQRSLTQLIGVFGALSALLALVGLAGMVSANVAARRREIGVRIALGAHPHEVSFLFLRRALRVSAVGVAVGALFALFAGRLVSAAVWGIEPFDAGALIVASGILVSGASIVAWTAARSAASVDPIMVLRDE